MKNYQTGLIYSMANLEEFLSKDKSMIIAPAGYGKTHTIMECLHIIGTGKKCLILTHTHAGIASIKEKMQKGGINPQKFSIETISSFALQYAKAFHFNKAEIPKAEDSNDYFNFAIGVATNILKTKPLSTVIRSSYSMLLVDEYQDCTSLQHKMILALSDILPTHILGDPLQGIFEFRNNTIVDMESDEEMQGLNQNIQTLDTPCRWNQHGSRELGQALSDIRALLLNGTPINLTTFHPHINVVIEPENGYLNPINNSNRIIWKEISNRNTDSLLFLHPISTSIYPRITFIQRFNNTVRLIESIDDKDYYKFSNYFDTQTGQKVINKIIDFTKAVSSKTVIKQWFKDNGALKNKRSDEDKIVVRKLQGIIDLIIQQKSFKNIAILISELIQLSNNKCYRAELKKDMIKALELAHAEGNTVYESMKKNRDILRRVGRSIKGRCIGTTLLTKGLEFDVVIILNAHLFTNPKHLYVALTRASKKLIVISQNPIINPH
ncbi:MAG: UvrD-helicase domain-containing protein [Bacteroidales bacterium]|nr:UvrD-helicase domain-containing protein [Bacteroidales bacterium]